MEVFELFFQFKRSFRLIFKKENQPLCYGAYFKYYNLNYNIVFKKNNINLHLKIIGGLAQLARAFDWQSKGQGFDSPILHIENQGVRGLPLWALFLFNILCNILFN